MRCTALVLAAAAILGLGCGPDPDPTDPTFNADDRLVDQADDGKADSATLLTGGFLRQNPSPGQISVLSLDGTNARFARETFVVCVAAPCDPIVETGSYKLTHAGSSRYIRFLDQDGNLIDRYAYKVTANTLKLRKVGDSGFYALDKTTLASEGEHCGGFVMHPPHCVPGLVCQGGINPDLPGTCQRPEPDACPDDQCGVPPRVLTQICDDGSTAGPVCQRNDQGQCGWVITACPDPIRCGGFAGLPCPDGFTCVDDPNDGCDPNQGGADCGGICKRTDPLN